jgi:2-succinyl-6-hydroxy-2,4-cyclohexadiene-1-carboxylate synthase
MAGVAERNVGVPEALVLLHGFGGTRRAWDQVIAHLDPQRYRPLALDLPGHGAAASPERPITFAACVEAVLAASPERFALCGYSMGGRIALHVALTAPRRVARLVLVSSTAGIEDASARARRRAADRELADELERTPFEGFIDRWRAQPLFAGDPPDVGRLAREDHRRNDPHSLATALRGLGTGEMDSLWGRLCELRMPVLLVAGSRDAKFSALARRMRKRVSNGDLLIVPGGHVLPLEHPSGVARALGRQSVPIENKR